MKHFQYQFLEHDHGSWLPMHDGLWRDYAAKEYECASSIAEKLAKREYDGNGMDADEFFLRVAIREVLAGGIKSPVKTFNVMAQELVRFQAEEVVYESKNVG